MFSKKVALMNWVKEEISDDETLKGLLNMNPCAIEYLKHNPDVIDYKYLSANPNAIDLLRENIEHVCIITARLNPNPAINILIREYLESNAEFPKHADKYCECDHCIDSYDDKDDEDDEDDEDDRTYYCNCDYCSEECKCEYCNIGFEKCCEEYAEIKEYVEMIEHDMMVNSKKEKDIKCMINGRNPAWYLISQMPAAIKYLKANPDKINWKMLSLNSAAIELLQSNPDKVDSYNLASNSNAIDMLYELHIKEEGFNLEELVLLNRNIFTYDYEDIKKAKLFETTALFTDPFIIERYVDRYGVDALDDFDEYIHEHGFYALLK